MLKSFRFLVFVLLLSSSIFGQVELSQVVPLSPNASAIAKYVDAPVGQFTGVPNISIPIYGIKSKVLTLPLQLSYHAGGYKVEEIASWVGMGWSLGTLPMISRKVVHLPDEGTGGFFYDMDTLTFQDVHEHWEDDPWMTNWVGLYMDPIMNGERDTEADIFYFTLPSKSGKFFWNQELNKFFTSPWTNLKITFENDAFKIVDDDGTIYIFATYETTETSGSGPGDPIKSSWMVDKVYNANKTDSLEFGYGLNNTFSTTYNHVIKCIGDCPTPTGSILSNTYITAKPISQIKFSNGIVYFNGQDSSRLDFEGSYALDNIAVYNLDSQLVKKMKLNYAYRTGDSCQYASSYQIRRLFLKEIIELDSSNIQGQKHSFLYDSVISIPCRISTAQDFWGYYNGVSGNTDLVPTTIINNTIQIAGANRNVNSAFTQFGILKRINYPTGGYGEFEYENHKAYNTNLPYNYQTKMAYLEGEAPNPITTDTYCDTFEVNNVAEQYLNNGLGGAFLNAFIGDVGCDLSGGGNSCAYLTIRGIDPGNSSVSMTVLYDNVRDIYVPNGRYEMKAVFDQDPPEYGGFYFIVNWKGMDSVEHAQNINRDVGGLRVKTIKTYDSWGGMLLKKYRYTRSYDSDTSSGDVFGPTFFVALDYFVDPPYTTLAVSPNLPAITHSGSFVGYPTVFEETDSIGSNGMTKYQFTFIDDDVSMGTPFVPPTSYEVFRGLLTESSIYKKQSTLFLPVSRALYEYPWDIFDSLQIYCVKIKIRGATAWFWERYTIAPLWTAMTRKTERTYDQNDTTKYIEVVTDYEYSTLHYQLATTKFINSKGDTIKSKIFYPQDLSLSGSAETARQELVNQSNLSIILKSEQYSNSSLLEEIKTNYKKFGINNIVMSEEIFQKIGSGSSESKIKFLKYNSSGNLISQQKTNDIVMSYIWDYNLSLPVAEVTNADSTSIAYASFESDGKGGWAYSGSPVTDLTSPTGTKCYSLSGGNLTKSNIASSISVVSYWSKSGSPYSINGSSSPTRTGKTIDNWTHYEHEFTGTSITISGSGNIDEVRLYPKGALMTTYTYWPLIGLSAQCDANSRISYFNYDAFNRLKLIKDQDKNVLKVIDYKYQQSQQQ